MSSIKLDNPAWHSLNEIHRSFAIGDDDIKFYQPGVCSFGGINSQQADLTSFLDNHDTLKSFFIIGGRPETTSNIIIENELICLQMICSLPVKIDYTGNIVYLNDEYKNQLYDLVNLVQPGYFEKNTSLMGDYFGIFKNDKLVAVTGERMKMAGFTEISAVVTHPGFTGKGFARQLVGYTANKSFEKKTIPYLHVAETNINAIRLYEKLGFTIRRKISFWKMRRMAE